MCGSLALPMKIECSLEVELPFVLNLSERTFTVLVEGQQVELAVSNERFSVGFWDGSNPRSIALAMGTIADLAPRFGKLIPGPTASKLKTVISHTFAMDVEDGELPSVPDEDLVAVVQGDLVTPSDPPQQDLESVAKKVVADLSADDLASFRRREQGKRRAREELSNREQLYLQALNRLIRWYAVKTGDFFVEEVGYHQLAATITRGVLRTVSLDGVQVESIPLVEKVPPLVKSPWMRPSPSVVAELETSLQAAADPDFADVLALRAKHLLERTSYRSAIAEAAASLEVAVARAIRSAMVAAGKTSAEIDAELDQTKMNFPKRAEETLKAWCVQGTIELDSTLWTQVKVDRKAHRNAVVHSDREPLRSDAEDVVARFTNMTKLVRQLY